MVPAVFPGFFLFLLFGVRSISLVAGLSPNDTKLIFYFGPQFEDSVTYELSDASKVLTHPKFTKNETHCYFHGYTESQESESIHAIVDAYYQRNTVNLLVVDWAVAARPNYLNAVNNVGEIAPRLADMMLDMFAAGLKRESFTVVGHSLGGQLAGQIGRDIIKKTSGAVKIYQMAVLDAAFPLFTLIPHKTVDKNDAEFLQAIHTDSGAYGQPITLGHVDFWPNGGGKNQPGCEPSTFNPFGNGGLCSHHRSWRFWVESVANTNGPYFWAFPSFSYELFLIKAWGGVQDLKDESIRMGIDCPREARGNYYLKTNSESPFAMGFDGY